VPKVTPEEFSEKWARRLKGATTDIRRGVERVTEAPTAKAAAKVEKMKAKLIEAIESGRWEAALRMIGLDEWKSATLEKGVGRISAGVDRATPKMTKFGSWLLSRIEAAQGKIKDMPDVTLEDSINRMTTFIREMAKEKYKK